MNFLLNLFLSGASYGRLKMLTLKTGVMQRLILKDVLKVNSLNCLTGYDTTCG